MNRFVSFLATAAVASILFAGAAVAQQTGAQAQPSPSHLAVAKEVAIGSGMVRSCARRSWRLRAGA